MQPDQIDTFLDLCDTRRFHRSAERLHVTQSTVSARIAALEAALGTALFTRSRAGALLTTEGLKFAPHARALRHAMAEARRSVTPTGEAALVLRLGIQTDLAAYRLGDWVQGFRRALPACAFYVEPDFSAQMCTDLAEGGWISPCSTPPTLPRICISPPWARRAIASCPRCLRVWPT